MRSIDKASVTYLALQEWLYKRYEGKTLNREMFQIIKRTTLVINDLMYPFQLGTKITSEEFLNAIKVLKLEEEESKDPLLKDFKEAVIKDFIENNEGIKMTNQHGVEKFYVNPKFW